MAATEAITAVDTTTLAVGMYWSTNGTSSQIASQEPSNSPRSYFTSLSNLSSFLQSPGLYGAFFGGQGTNSISSSSSFCPKLIFTPLAFG